jgi:hypothetical protein
MNDNELKARLQAMRVPASKPAADRAAMERSLAAFQKRDNYGSRPTPHRAWREWFWPSPYAWGAIACIWLGLLSIGSPGHPVGATHLPQSSIAQWSPSFDPAGLTASSDYREILKQIEQSKP